MQEVLSRTKSTETLSADTEFFEIRLDNCELRLSDTDFAPKPAFRVRQANARWDDGTKMVVWDAPEVWIFENIQEAQTRYQQQRLALTERGFTYSDMDW